MKQKTLQKEDVDNDLLNQIQASLEDIKHKRVKKYTIQE